MFEAKLEIVKSASGNALDLTFPRKKPLQSLRASEDEKIFFAFFAAVLGDLCGYLFPGKAE